MNNFSFGLGKSLKENRSRTALAVAFFLLLNTHYLLLFFRRTTASTAYAALCCVLEKWRWK
jgi:hypothetical protein